MSSVRKFLFDESFDVDAPPRRQRQADDDYFDNIPLPEPEPEPEPELPPEPPPPVFGEADLAAARAAGFAEGETAGKSTGYGKGFLDGNNAGRKDGYENARAEIEATVQARIANALETIGNGVQHLLNEHYATSAQRADQPVHIALAIVRKLMPELARRGGLMEVEGLVRACLTDLIDEPRHRRRRRRHGGRGARASGSGDRSPWLRREADGGGRFRPGTGKLPDRMGRRRGGAGHRRPACPDRAADGRPAGGAAGLTPRRTDCGEQDFLRF
ncbi:hypothetical protein [Azospirillum brasilense]|uniref:hypothetical protein n=1 Tax=Azospirillum brasilense TaxID=192 RepID=UPI00039D2E08